MSGCNNSHCGSVLVGAFPRWNLCLFVCLFVCLFCTHGTRNAEITSAVEMHSDENPNAQTNKQTKQPEVKKKKQSLTSKPKTDEIEESHSSKTRCHTRCNTTTRKQANKEAMNHNKHASKCRSNSNHQQTNKQTNKQASLQTNKH